MSSLWNFKYCKDCIKAGTSCYPSISMETGKPIRESFCQAAYRDAMSDFYRKGKKTKTRIIKKKKNYGN